MFNVRIFCTGVDGLDGREGRTVSDSREAGFGQGEKLNWMGRNLSN